MASITKTLSVCIIVCLEMKVRDPRCSPLLWDFFFQEMIGLLWQPLSMMPMVLTQNKKTNKNVIKLQEQDFPPVTFICWKLTVTEPQDHLN